jgi:hypothetical protein
MRLKHRGIVDFRLLEKSFRGVRGIARVAVPDEDFRAGLGRFRGEKDSSVVERCANRRVALPVAELAR